MSYGYIYVTSNDVNEWYYVGQSTVMDPERVRTYMGSGDYLLRMIAELGIEHFQKKILGYYDTKTQLDYAEVFTIAKLRAAGADLLNGGVGGPRAHSQFIRSMLDRFGVLPQQPEAWFQTVKTHPREVMAFLEVGDSLTTEDYYRELEIQYRQTQDLSSPCPSCGAEVGAICRTKTGNPSKSHVKRAR